VQCFVTADTGMEDLRASIQTVERKSFPLSERNKHFCILFRVDSIFLK
jgi:hypothetical protein